MTNLKTLLQLAGADLTPATVKTACLVLIDMQNEYCTGPIAVPDATAAIANAALLLAAARLHGGPIVHVAHKGRTGGLFDRAAERGQIVEVLVPRPGELVVEKGLPNSFAGTDLTAHLQRFGVKELILAGFMTHMCVSSTARAALDLGYRVTIDAMSCATRDLPDGHGGVLSHGVVHTVALAELADRFAIIARSQEVLVS